MVRQRNTTYTSDVLIDHRSLRYVFLALWVAVALTALYVYAFHRDLIRGELEQAFSGSALVASALYLLLNAVRPFTLIPPTFILVAAIPFIAPLPLFGLTLVSIAASSSGFYWFSRSLHLDEMFERDYKQRIEQLRSLLQRHELPIIVGWSFFLVLPTDLLCYVCGTLRINFPKFLVGVLIGEGTIFGLYIFFGRYLVDIW